MTSPTPMFPNPDWPTIRTILRNEDRVLLYGPPGVSKTTEAMLSAPGGRAYPTTLTRDDSSSALLGYPKNLPDGTWEYSHGPAVAAYKNAGRLVVNEIQRGGESTHNILMALTDRAEGGKLLLPSGEMLTQPAGYSCVCTMNNDPHEMLDEALFDRLILVPVFQPSPEQLATLQPDLSRICQKMYAEKAPNPIDGPPYTFRQFRQIQRLRQYLTLEQAVHLALGAPQGDQSKVATLVEVIKLAAYDWRGNPVPIDPLALAQDAATAATDEDQYAF
jgi:hypothetical protein